MFSTAVAVFFLFSSLLVTAAHGNASGLVGGQGDWSYVYEPSMLPLSDDLTVDSIQHAHGIFVGDDEVIITYVDSYNDSRCLLRWRELHEPAELIGPGASLCAGVPHGLRAAKEDNNQTYLYHANNQQALHKTTLEGNIVWSTVGTPSNETFSPTWFDGQPSSPYIYLADGYGSSKVYVYYRANGTYTGTFVGGHGTAPGLFSTCHAITWDWRVQQMVVSDRENHRLQFFSIDPTDPSVFRLQRIMSFSPLLNQPCNIRFHAPTKHAIVPFLEGTVAILDDSNHIVSVLNITDALGDRGFLHPHDAHFMSNGDFVLVTWNPGRIGYFRRVPEERIETSLRGVQGVV